MSEVKENLEMLSKLGDDAKALRDNPAWQAIWDYLDQSIEDRGLTCDTTNKDLAADILRAKQLLVGIKREIEHLIDTGKAANKELQLFNQQPTVREFKR